MILVQATLNLFAVLGLAPLTGVTLPFVSYGNCSLIVMLASVGLLLNIASGRAAASPKAKPQSGRGPLVPAALRDCARSRVAEQAMQNEPTVVIAAGGTAGHVVPALAVADALGLSGAAVSFIGTRERAEAELVPAAGYEIDFLAVRGLDRRNPLKAAAAAVQAAAAVPAAQRVLRERGADAVLGGGGYVAGPAGPRRAAPAPAAGPDRGRQPPRPRQPHARAPRAPGLPRVPDPRPRGRPLPASPAARCPPSVLAADRGAARERFGIPAEDRCLLVFGGSLGARTINRAALAAFAERRRRRRASSASSTSPAAATSPRPPPASKPRSPGATSLLEYEPNLGDRARRLPTSSSPAPAGRSSSWRPRAARRSSSPSRYATADHQRDEREPGWPTPARRSSFDDAELTPELLAREAAGLLADAERLERMAAASRGLAMPDAAERIAAEVLSAIDASRAGR